MSADAHDLLEALSSAGVTIEARNGRLYYRPRSALTTEMLAVVKSCKADLLKILKSLSLSAVGALFSPGTPRAQASPDAPEYSGARPMSKVDAEFDRFAAVAKPMAGGGLYCPVYGSPEMPRGVPIEDWRAFERDCGNLGRREG